MSPLAASPPRGDVWQWPTGGPTEVLRPFDPPPVPWAAGHRGADLAHAAGANVVAAGDGVVVHAGPLAGRGVVSIEHAGGLRTTYEPVTALVGRGAKVERGQVIGVLEAGHCESGCLHLGLRTGPREYRDPLSLFGEVRVRLHPLAKAAAG